MKAEKWVQDISRELGNMTSEEDKALGYNKIAEPRIGDIVYYKDTNEFRKVKIISGNYLDPTYGRVSNFWYWKEIDEQGNESNETCHGYGAFYVLV